MKVYSSFKSSKNKNYYKQPFYKSNRFYVIFFLILLVALFIFWSATKNSNNEETQISLVDEEPEQIPIATIEYVQGTLEIEQNNSWDSISNSTPLEPGAHLRTSKDSKAIVAFPEGSLIRMDEETEIILEEFSLTDITIQQLEGRAFHRVIDGTPAIYRVINNEIEMTALGTGFNVTLEDDVVKLFVSESRVKTKIYEDETLTSIRNMRTIDQAYFATIDPSKTDNDEIIDSEELELSDILDNEWLNWNKDKDEEISAFLGIYADNIELSITSPNELEFETEEKTIEITGTTDVEAEIFINGEEIDNDNGKFSYEYDLESGENTIDVSVKKERQKNKKTLYVTSNQEDEAEIILSATKDENSVKLNWETKNEEAPYGFRTVMSSSSNPTFPDNNYQTVSADTFNDTWKDLDDNTYYFRVCVYEDQKCTLYSNQESVTISNDEEEEEQDETIDENAKIDLTVTKSDDDASLSWTTSNLENIDNYHVLINTAANPTFPGSSAHVLTPSVKTDTWSDLKPGTYHFRVCAYLDDKCQLYSNNYSIEIKEETVELTPSINLSGSSVGGTINIYWQASNLTSNKGFYALIQKDTSPTYPNSDYKLLQSSTANSTSWLDLEVGDIYHIFVCEDSGNGCGTKSNEVVITVK